ncbi:MAG: Nif3-like dinuclear metal center hexameric protein [Pirellulales bacterium]|nr:Nif3-like dinuclear metal center hexameric protein [Pirellulales bacterium]
MAVISDICAFLDRFAPVELAEDWDNVGLLIGDAAVNAKKIMTCLTVTPASCREAIEREADLIVTHHPFPFRPVKRLTRATPEGRMLLDLISAGVAVYSPHTAFDSAAAGINQQFAAGLGLVEIQPLIEKAASHGGVSTGSAPLGTGRHGKLPSSQTLGKFVQCVKNFLRLNQAKYVGNPDRTVNHVAIACGSAGEFLSEAQAVGADCFVTGETSFHTCLAAKANDTALILTGHFASERFAVVELSRTLAREYSEAVVWASEEERDPIAYG